MKNKLTLFLEEFIPYQKDNGNKINLADFCGKRAFNLSKLKSIGLEYPPSFVITSEGISKLAENNNNIFPDLLWQQILKSIRQIEENKGKKFGQKNPLFFNISGPIICCGVFNIGLNDFTVRELSNDSNPTFAYSAYSRLISSFSSFVFKISVDLFDEKLDEYLISRNYKNKSEFKTEDWIYICKLFKSIVVKETGKSFPQDPFEQIRKSIQSIYEFSSTELSQNYSSKICLKVLPEILITQSVFGNIDNNSASFIVSTHNLTNGSIFFNGRYLRNSDFFDVNNEDLPTLTTDSLSEDFPEVYTQIASFSRKICKSFGSPITISLVLEKGKLYAISTDIPSFAGLSRLTASTTIQEKELYTTNEIMSTLQPNDVLSLIKPSILNKPRSVFCSGFPGGNGAIIGKVCLSGEKCIKLSSLGESVILFKKRIRITDLKSLLYCNGIVSSNGSNISTNASFMRSLSIPSAIGCKDLIINYKEGIVENKGLIIKEGDIVTIENGNVYIGEHTLQKIGAINNNDAKIVLDWADSIRKDKFNVYSIANNNDEVRTGLLIGSDGIGSFSIDSLFNNDIEIITNFLLNPKDESLQHDIETKLILELSDVLYNAGSNLITITLMNNSILSYLPSLIDLTKDITKLKILKQYDKKFNLNNELIKKELILKNLLLFK